MPLYEEHSCALGNLTLHYLDELTKSGEPTAESNRLEMKERGQKGWIIKSNFSGSLDDAFRLWDAVSVFLEYHASLDVELTEYQVYKAVQEGGEGSSDIKMWDEVNAWLSNRR